MQVAAMAAIATIVIELLGAVAAYVGNYYTTSVGQWVANDLRMRNNPILILDEPTAAELEKHRIEGEKALGLFGDKKRPKKG
jgi:hypothetical protein